MKTELHSANTGNGCATPFLNKKIKKNRLFSYVLSDAYFLFQAKF